MVRIFPAMRALSVAALTLPACGECDETWTRNVDETLDANTLAEVRASASSDEERCDDACLSFDDLHGNGAVIACTATGADPSLPAWDEGQSSVQLMCTLEGLDVVGCTQ